MGCKIVHPASAGLWARAHAQHGVVTRGQMLALGFSSRSITHRVASGRLHRVHTGVYAVGRPGLTQHGLWMAAVLSCGPDAVLSHGCAAALLGLRRHRGRPIEVSVPPHVARHRPGLVVHRQIQTQEWPSVVVHGIPVTSAVRTLIDLATRLERRHLEAAINEADKRDVIDSETLRSALCGPAVPGLGILRASLDRRTFTLTDSDLERRFLPLVARAGLAVPQTGRRRNGFKVDFLWSDLGLIVETDGLRYHRTPGQQARDRLRDQRHTAAGLTHLRFTHAQVAFESEHVCSILTKVAQRLQRTG